MGLTRTVVGMIAFVAVAIGAMVLMLSRGGPALHDSARIAGVAEPPYSDDIATTIDFSDLRVPREDLVQAARGLDAIQSITKPDRTPVAQAEGVPPDARVIVVELGDAAVAYPIFILDFHEIINDVVADTPIAVVY